jgi:hypothetical protein
MAGLVISTSVTVPFRVVIAFPRRLPSFPVVSLLDPPNTTVSPSLSLNLLLPRAFERSQHP